MDLVTMGVEGEMYRISRNLDRIKKAKEYFPGNVWSNHRGAPSGGQQVGKWGIFATISSDEFKK